jgi:Calx-beta domain/FG-GAP-like repeat
MKRRTCLHVEALDDRCLPSFTPAVSYAVGSGPYDVVTADFNRDGIPDLATANYYGNTVSVLLGKADGTFQPAKTSATGANPLSLAVGDFNGDLNLDLATANRDADSVSVLLGTGTGTFQAPTSVIIGQPTSVAVGDFNGDGTLDLGVTCAIPYSFDPDLGTFYTITANVLLGNGIAGFSSPNSTWLGAEYWNSTSATAANLDGVGPDDLVVATPDSGYYRDVAVLAGDASGFLQLTNDLDSGAEAVAVAVGDVNADGALDIVTANGSFAGVSVLLGDGLGGYGTAQTFAAGSYPDSLALGDFTGDGNVDIAVTGFHDYRVNLLYGAGDGAFSVPIPFATGLNPASLASGDFDGDGWLDLATANFGGYNVSVLINDHSWPPADAPSVSINDASVTEGNAGTVNATFTVTLSAAYGQPVTVNYSTANNTAIAGSDFQTASGTLTFAPGETSKTITVLVNGDRLPEPNETFVVNLSSRTNATIADGQGAGTVRDDEPRISITDVSKAEGNAGQTTLFTFTVTLTVAYDQTVTISFRTVNGTAKASQGDYVSRTGTLTFAPGETTKTITIEVKGDSKKEGNETFYLDLFGLSSNGLFTKSRGLGTILNDD